MQDNVEKKCPHCGNKTTNPQFCSRSCAAIFTNKLKQKHILKCNWQDIQKCHDNGMNQKELCSKFGIGHSAMTRAMRAGILVKREIRVHLSEEAKSHLSEVRKKWLKDNPERHPWRSKDRFKSVPCNILKDMFAQEGLSFLEEYIPIGDRFYSLDIAFPDKKIAIEVNGNQHYDSEGKLKSYYQERHDNIETDGWHIIELHYSTVYNADLIKKLVSDLKQSHGLGITDYSFYQEEQKRIRNEKITKRENKFNCKKCGIQRKFKSANGLCSKCYKETTRQVPRPSREQLFADVSSMSIVSVGKKYGVSDNSVRKWCKLYGIIFGSGRGYWQKKNSHKEV